MASLETLEHKDRTADLVNKDHEDPRVCLDLQDPTEKRDRKDLKAPLASPETVEGLVNLDNRENEVTTAMLSIASVATLSGHLRGAVSSNSEMILTVL